MMNHTRRTLLLGSLAGLGTVLYGNSFSAQGAADTGTNARVVKIQAKRFSYTPNQITLKKGQSVILEFSSVDFMHGFKIPDMNIRADLPPGQITRVRLNPDKAGVYEFLCDNFCGSGHEEMNGKIIVEDSSA